MVSHAKNADAHLHFFYATGVGESYYYCRMCIVNTTAKPCEIRHFAALNHLFVYPQWRGSVAWQRGFRNMLIFAMLFAKRLPIS